MKPILLTFFCTHGRLSRRGWLFRLAGLALACAALGSLAASAWGDGAATPFSALFLGAAAVQSVQRLHDAGMSGWQLLWALVPVLGPLWLLAALLRRGVGDASRFAKPLPRTDYLQVDIAG
ncbi:membrane protein of unknown function (plasmid) [Ralstonia solanacearum CMR15]|nr:membrane protein of unknown function [Ralstonia solanacearum CMR15]